MPTSFTIFGFTLYVYGLLISLAMIITAKVSEHILKKRGFNGEVIWEIALWVVLLGLIGARAWHVVTDWSLYQDNLITALYIWRGGMSILGGLLGGLIGVLFCRNQLTRYSISVLMACDALVVGLPFGQAIGRLGNWVNQELYGYPTDLPWKLFIAPEYRVSGYEQYQYFHPLFVYELIALLCIGGLLWRLSLHNKYGVGTGIPIGLYLLCYSVIRFFLEFLRIEKTTIGTSSLGVNQMILALVAVMAVVFLQKKYLCLKQEPK